ncbi:hypothetical protein ACLOJK_036896 [Asimina triloba]
MELSSWSWRRSWVDKLTPTRPKSFAHSSHTLWEIWQNLSSKFWEVRTKSNKGEEQLSEMAMGAARKVFFSAMFATMTIAAFSAAVGASSSREETFARNTIASHEIVIFSKSYCPYDTISSLTPLYSLYTFIPPFQIFAPIVFETCGFFSFFRQIDNI